MEAAACPSAAASEGQGRAGERRRPRARLTCRASPRPMQVPAHARPISAPGHRQVCPPGSHRPEGGSYMTQQGGQAAGPAHIPAPPRLPAAQVEQKPGQRASAMGLASQPGGRAPTPVQAPGLEGGSVGSQPVRSACPGAALQRPLPLGPAASKTRGRSWPAPHAGPKPQLWQQWGFCSTWTLGNH